MCKPAGGSKLGREQISHDDLLAQKGGRVGRQKGGRGRTKPVRRQTGGGSGYVFASTGHPYHGKVIEVGGAIFTTTGNTKESTSQKVITLSEYNRGKAG